MITVTDFQGAFCCKRTKNHFSTPEQNYSVLSYRLKGESVFTCAGQQIRTDQNTILYIPSHVAYTQASFGEECLIAVHFVTNKKIAERITAFRCDANYAEKLFKQILSDAAHNKYLAVGGVYALLGYIFDMEKSRTAQVYPKKVRMALHYMNDHFTDCALNVYSVAEYCGVSGAYLRKEFKKYLKVPPMQYLMQLRMRRALELLNSGYFTVKETAALCGYYDEKNFSAAFKKYTGEPPSKRLK